MSVVAPPPQDESELLIREARARQRRRRIAAAALVAVLAAGALAVYAISGGEGSQSQAGRPSPVVNLSRCRSDQLRLSVPPWGAAAGTFFEPATLTNTSGSNCAVAGWPAVRRFNTAGRAIPVRFERWVYRLRGPAPFAFVKLAPGGSATFEIFGADWNHQRDRACRTARTIQVMPRGAGGWLSATASPPDRGQGIPACGNWLLGPLVAGRIANPPPFAFSLFRRSR